jgi:acetyl-CoA carboxylase carboxyltransferase component
MGKSNLNNNVRIAVFIFQNVTGFLPGSEYVVGHKTNNGGKK